MTLGDGPLISSLDLAPELSSVREVRRYATATLQGWHVPAAIVEDSITIVSELVANAVRHAKTASAAEPSTEGLGVGACTVVLALWPGSVCVFVCDQDRRPPVLQHPSPQAEGGRGLQLVDRLCESWGYIHRDHGPGKTVWAEVLFPQAPEPAPERSGIASRPLQPPGLQSPGASLSAGGRSCASAGGWDIPDTCPGRSALPKAAR